MGLGQIPRNRLQGKDMARRRAVNKGSFLKNMSGAGRPSDLWYMLLNECKIQGRDPNSAFVRDVRVGAEPFCVVGTNRQLNDLKRFCCNPLEYRPLTIDHTMSRRSLTNISWSFAGKTEITQQCLARCFCTKEDSVHLLPLWCNPEVS